MARNEETGCLEIRVSWEVVRTENAAKGFLKCQSLRVLKMLSLFFFYKRKKFGIDKRKNNHKSFFLIQL